MGDYRPIDLAGLCNASLDAIETQRVPPLGEQRFHGIPFLIGDPTAPDASCFVVVEPGADPVTVPVECEADRLIIAHRRSRIGDTVVTHRVPLEDVGKAFEALERKPEGFVKSVVVMGRA